MEGKTMTPEEYAREKKRAADRERSRRYRLAHPEKVKACQKRWYQEHREEYLAKQRATYHDNLETSRAYMRSWAKSYREKHREEINARKRALYQAKKQAQQAGE